MLVLSTVVKTSCFIQNVTDKGYFTSKQVLKIKSPILVHRAGLHVFNYLCYNSNKSRYIERTATQKAPTQLTFMVYPRIPLEDAPIAEDLAWINCNTCYIRGAHTVDGHFLPTSYWLFSQSVDLSSQRGMCAPEMLHICVRTRCMLFRVWLQLTLTLITATVPNLKVLRLMYTGGIVVSY